MMRRSVPIVGIVLAILLMVAGSEQSYRSLRDLLDTFDLVDHTQTVLRQIEGLLTALVDAETGQRGYVITGDEAFLEPYQHALAAVPSTLSRLRDLTSDNATQQARLDRLRPLIDDRLAIIAAIVEKRRSVATALMNDTEVFRRGKAAMDAIRVVIAEMKAEESRLYEGRRATVADSARLTGIVLLVSVALALLTILAVFVLMQKETRRRRRSEEALNVLNETLEQRVLERTQELTVSEARYRKLVDLMLEVVWIHVDGGFVFANDPAARMFGFELPEELVGLRVLDLVHPDDRGQAAERTRILTEARQPVPMTEMRFIGPNDRTLVLEVQAAPFDYQGKPAVLVVGRDITERRVAEDQLRQAQKMEAVGQLTGGLAHDFNNLLTVVIGNLDLLASRLENDAKGRKLAQNALSAGLRGAELTRKLLAFSRKQSLEATAVDVNDLVRGMTEMLRRSLGEGITIDVSTAGGLWPVETDTAQLESALMNLAVNSRDAMPDGGHLTIETANSRLDEHYAAQNTGVTPGDYVMLAVTDTGGGIPPEHLDRVIEPFFTTKEVGKGSGLGLSMVYGFAKQSGGHLKIYSEVGHGTTVRLYLPRGKAGLEMAAAPTAQAAEPSPAGELILVIDDNAHVRATVTAQLAELGYRTLEAADGASAIDLLKATPGVDLLFTDIVMPGGMNGVQLGEAARRIRPEIRTLYTSGFTEASIANGNAKAIAKEHLLSKPYRKHELARKVREALSRG